MNRRNALRAFAAAGAIASGRLLPAQSRSSGKVKITNVRTSLTQPAGDHPVIVKLLTSEPGLYGIGCATHRERPLAVASAVNDYQKPFVAGKYVEDIKDIWQSAYVSSHFWQGVTLNNALSGVDGALWNIMGKRAGMPVYKLVGGKLRTAAPFFTHTGARELPKLEDQVRKVMSEGYRHVRVQLAVPGFSGYCVSNPRYDVIQKARPKGVVSYPVFESTPYINNTVKMFDYLRTKIGFDVDLVHDIHKRVPPAQALRLAKAVEPYRFFFLEDANAPEDVAWFQMLRQQSATSLAMKELFVNRSEWLPPVANRRIDFIRCHISVIGGLTQARKVAAACQMFGVRTAWHGPGNVSPVGNAVNLHLDLTMPNFGIQEGNTFSNALRDVFPGTPEISGGYLYANNTLGFGVDIDEKAVARFPSKRPGDSRGNDRRLDGSIVRP